MNKLIYFLLIVCCSWQTAFAQDVPAEDSPANTIAYGTYSTDSTDKATVEDEEEDAEQGFQKPTIRIVTADSIQKLSKQDAFGYMQYIDSFYRNNKPKAEIQKQQTEEKKSTSIFDITGIRILYWGIALMAVLFLLYKLLFSNTSVFAKSKRIQPVAVEEQDTPLTTDHISQLLDNAIKAKNYRLAIRLMYLQTLSLLGEKEHLLLSPQKTNYQYVQELGGQVCKRHFQN